jgi:hypothetical protein
MDSGFYGDRKTTNRGEYNMVGAAVVGHENYHKTFGDSEGPAYKEELRILQKFNPDVKQTYVQDRIKYVQSRPELK